MDYGYRYGSFDDGRYWGLSPEKAWGVNSMDIVVMTFLILIGLSLAILAGIWIEKYFLYRNKREKHAH